MFFLKKEFVMNLQINYYMKEENFNQIQKQERRYIQDFLWRRH